MAPRVVFCITCKNRTQHIKQTLPLNLSRNKDPNTKFVLLNYGSQDDLDCYIKHHHSRDIESGKLVYYHYNAWHPFRMAHAKNMAHRCGLLEGADILVNLDADNMTGEDFDRYVIETMQGTNRFMWPRMIKGVLPKGISGRIVVSREAFLNAGGYDEKYEKHSPDDKDFKARLVRLEYEPFEIDPKHLDAVRHNDKMRFREYPEAAFNGEDEFAIDQFNRVVNYGNVGCGRVFRNWFKFATDLRPIPTRIFGIGMHKTATTSLHHALQILGYKSGHWKDAHWAKAIYHQMINDGKSLILEKCYALSDLPIPLLYQQLDRAYPGSKFVLTLRNENDWIESVRKHWDPKYNPNRWRWKHDPFTKQVHRLTYGQSGFDAELFLRVYRKHNADVLNYFRDRSDDLIALDMSNGDGWDKLCPFLRLPVPSVPYPSSNVAPVVEPSRHDRGHGWERKPGVYDMGDGSMLAVD